MAATPEDLLSDFMTRHKNCHVMVTMNGGSKHTGRLEKADAYTLWLKSGDDSPLLLFRSAIESNTTMPRGGPHRRFRRGDSGRLTNSE